MKKSCWNDLEIKELFNLVEEFKKQNKPLKDAFLQHSLKFKRKPNSVRNYYYACVDSLQNDLAKASSLGIDLSIHNKLDFKYFSKQEEKDLINKIDELVKSGLSIRKACLNLSNGDVKKMLRYQNKYRNYITKSKKGVKKMDNIIAFTNRKKTLLSDSDITSLFIGLVRLVKKNAMQEVEERDRAARESANQSLKKALVELGRKDKEIEKFKEELVKLKLENSKLIQNIVKLKCDKAEKITKNEFFIKNKLDGGQI